MIRRSLLLMLLLASTAAHSQVIDYDPRRPTELRECDDHAYRGRAAPAKECYTRILTNSSAIATRAEAAWALGDIQRANALFREAAQDTANSTQPRVRWGRLFLQAHRPADAVALFKEVLQGSPKDVHARLGLARVYAEQFEGEARRLVDELIAENSALTEAHLLAARMALEEGRYEDVDASLDRALRGVEKQKLPPLDVYAMRAVLELSRKGEARSDWLDKALVFNPHYGAVYQDLAHFEVMRRRYKEATVLLRRAVEVQPDLWEAQAELGANLLRTGDIIGARQHLTLAYSGDAFSATTVNTLRLLDRVDEFDLRSVPLTIPSLQGTGTVDVELRMRLARSEAEALRPYVQQLASDSIASLSKRYGFEPREPVTLELYPDHDDFAVRVAALPGIGLLGVTFGYLVAMDSPSGRPVGEFHWGSTLWHEMAHVFTLELTQHRVPRWLSEGISVFEEWQTGPTPGVNVTPDALVAMRDDKLLPVSELDSGFIRPQYPRQVQVSYMQAGLLCLFIEQRWGFDKLVTLLRQFTRDTSTKAAIEATFKMPAADFDKAFDAFLRKRYATLLAGSEEWQKRHEEAGNAFKNRQWNEAILAARRAIEIYPEHIGDDSAYLVLARALDKSGQRYEAIDVLRNYRRVGGWAPAALRDLANWLDATGNKDEATEVFVALNYVDPLNVDQHRLLGERLLTANRAEPALREYRVLMALSPQDPAPAGLGIARSLRQLGDKAGSRRYLLDALASAPHYKPAQELLLQTIEERKTNE
ncbi:MAG: tetratricopeptide repeat protein [Steroidobacteraceae bacterium]